MSYVIDVIKVVQNNTNHEESKISQIKRINGNKTRKEAPNNSNLQRIEKSGSGKKTVLTVANIYYHAKQARR